MATIRRKPVSSAFYESDFPPLFTSVPIQSASSMHTETLNFEEARSEGNNFSESTLQSEEPTGNGSQSRPLDNHRDMDHHRSTSNDANLAALVPQIPDRANDADNVSEPPAGEYDPERLIQHHPFEQQNGTPNSILSGRLWKPFWLRKGTLIAFLVLYIVLLASVTLLWRISQHNDGFNPRISTNHYIWAYGPTAVLIIVVSLWRQVEYHCKVLAPWHELKRGAEASRSLLLDYVSPFQLASLWLALSHKMTSVVAAITAFACLKLVTIFSAGFLVLSRTVVTDLTYPLELRAAFNGTAFNSTNSTSESAVSNSPFSATGPIYAYWGHLANNLTLPVGAKEFLAYTPFQAQGVLPRNSALSAEVDVMLPQFDCEPAKIRLNLSDQDPELVQYWALVTLDAPSCTVEGVDLGGRYPRGHPKQVTGQWSLVDCKEKATTAFDDEILMYKEMDIRFMVAVTDFRNTRSSIVPNSGNHSILNWIGIEGINAVICKTAYSMSRANLTYDTSKKDESGRFSIAAPNSASGKLLEDFSFDNLSSALYDIIRSSSHIVDIDSYTTPNLESENPDIMSMLMLLSEGESSLQAFFADAGIMKSAAEKVLNGIAAQYAQQTLLKPASEARTGHIVYSVDRLKVQTTSMALIVACLVILVCLTAAVLFNRPYDVVSRRPDSLGAMAVILTSSQHLQNVLADLGRSPTMALRQSLSPFHFSSQMRWNTDKGATFGIKVSQSESSPRVLKNSPDSHHWHRPLSVRKGFIITVLASLLILIAVLEGLQHASDRHKGFLTFHQDNHDISSSTTILIRYIPAVFMLLLATSFNMLDFTVSTFAPFSGLRAGSLSAQRSIFSHLVGQLPPVSLYLTVTQHHWGALFANLAGLTGSMLAIIVSGLLVVETISLTTIITVEQLDAFTIDGYNRQDPNSTVTLSLIELFNMSFPAFTSQDLALPYLQLSPDNSSIAQIVHKVGDVSLSVQVPALRASLDCKRLSQDDVEFILSDIRPRVALDVTVNLPDGCGSPIAEHSFYFPVARGEEPTFYIPDSDNGWSFAGGIADLNTTIQSPDCPALAFFFGSFKMNTTSYDNVTVMSCSEHIEEVQAFTAFNLPTFTIDPSDPPLVNESSAQLLQNITSNVTAVQFDIAHQFNTGFISFYSSGDTSFQPLDPFFQALTLGSDAVPPSELLGPNNIDRLVDRVNHLYRKYIAQLINANMRTVPLYPHPTYNATIALPTTRLKMNNGSKVTLQILLAAMFVCGSLAYFLTDMRHTLPHNPHTIAGTMSLLAGSEMCSRNVVPEGVEWMDDKSLMKAGVFEGYFFSLGWWDDRDQDGRPKKKRFGIDVGRAQKAV